MQSETRYARNGDVHIAYRVFGNGPRDIVLVPGTVSHVEIFWELPAYQHLLKRLSSFARVVVFDKRGQGLSDRIAEQTLEERIADLRAVMDEVGIDRGIIYGWSEGGQMSMKFAAAHPERTAGLILYGAYASIRSEPWAVTPDCFSRFLGSLTRHWGEGILVRINAPSRNKDGEFVRWFGRLERAVASPGAINAMMRANYGLDVSPILSSIKAPTLILHREGDPLVPVRAGRHLAWNIPEARYFELPGDDHLLGAFDADVLEMMVDKIEEFVTGSRPCRVAAPHARPVLSDDAAAEGTDAENELLDYAIAEMERCREAIAWGAHRAEIEGILSRARALVAAASGAWQESEAQFLKALMNFRRHKMAWQEARTFGVWERSLAAGVDRSALIGALDPTSVTAGARPRLAEPSQPDMFCREGDYWTLAWQGNVLRLKNSKGLGYIHYLLSNAGRQVPAIELAAMGRSMAADGLLIENARSATNLGDSGVMLDVAARRHYRRRIADLREDMAEAERLNDVGRAAGLRWELERLSDQLAAAVGLGGRGRTTGTHRERARLMVTKAIKAAISRVRAGDRAVGHHLATTIRTGNFCSYDPPPDHPGWRL